MSLTVPWVPRSRTRSRRPSGARSSGARDVRLSPRHTKRTAKEDVTQELRMERGMGYTETKYHSGGRQSVLLRSRLRGNTARWGRQQDVLPLKTCPHLRTVQETEATK